MPADRILKLKAGLDGNPIPVGETGFELPSDGQVGQSLVSDGAGGVEWSQPSSGIDELGQVVSALGFGYFTGANPGSGGTRVYGTIGKMVPCKPGDTFKINWTINGSGGMAKGAYIYPTIPDKQYGSLSGELGTLEVANNKIYTIPQNMTNAKSVFFPVVTWVGMSGYESEAAGVAYIESTYGSGSQYQVEKNGVLSIDSWYLQNQEINFVVSSDRNMMFYASLFAAVSDLVSAKVAILGDSLTEQSAGMVSGAADSYGFNPISYSGFGWASRFTRKYMLDTKCRGVGMQWWYSTTARPNGGTDAVQRLVNSGYEPDYIILEYGTNDIWSAPGKLGTYEDAASNTAESTAAAMRWCIETLQSNFPSAKILVVLPCMHNGMNGAPPAAQATYYTLANQILDDYAIARVDMAHKSGIVYSMMGNTDGVHLAVPPSGGGGFDSDTVAVEKYSRAIEKALLSM